MSCPLPSFPYLIPVMSRTLTAPFTHLLLAHTPFHVG